MDLRSLHGRRSVRLSTEPGKITRVVIVNPHALWTPRAMTILGRSQRDFNIKKDKSAKYRGLRAITFKSSKKNDITLEVYGR
jgi:hypothetical protein